MIKTTPQFWDCECQTNYIHPSSQDRCAACGARREDQPDARVNEVKLLLKQQGTSRACHLWIPAHDVFDHYACRTNSPYQTLQQAESAALRYPEEPTWITLCPHSPCQCPKEMPMNKLIDLTL